MTYIQGNTFVFSTPTEKYSYDAGYSGKCVFANEDATYSYTTTNYSGSAYHFSIPSTITSGYSAGTYTLMVFAIDDDDRHTIHTEYVKILPDPVFGGDIRTSARKILDAIDAALEGVATNAQQSISIAGKSISKYSIPDLMVMRDKYAQIVKREETEEKLSQGLPAGNKVYVRFKNNGGW